MSKSKSTTEIQPGSYVVITTIHRGVFGGTLVKRDTDEVTLDNARVCVHWSSETRGFVGLAVTGPMNGSRVSAAAARMVIPGVSSIVLCSPEAQKRWESEPWK